MTKRIIFYCFSCGQKISMTKAAEGRSFKCPQCSRVITVPAADGIIESASPEQDSTSHAEENSTPIPPTEATPPSNANSNRRKIYVRADASQTKKEEQPAVEKNTQAKEHLFVMMNIGVISLLIGAVAAGFFPKVAVTFSAFIAASFILGLFLIGNRSIVNGSVLLIGSIVALQLFVTPAFLPSRDKKEEGSTDKVERVRIIRNSDFRVDSQPADRSEQRPSRPVIAKAASEWEDESPAASQKPLKDKASPPIAAPVETESTVVVDAKPWSESDEGVKTKQVDLPAPPSLIPSSPEVVAVHVVTQSVAAPIFAGPPTIKLPFKIYDECSEELPYQPSGWMGYIDGIAIDDCCSDNPHNGKTCIKIDYNVPHSWGGIAWQTPANNWGAEPEGGYNLTGAKKLTVWARAADSGTIAVFKIGVQSTQRYKDTSYISSGKVILTHLWQKYTISIKRGQNMSRIINGFVCVVEGVGYPSTVYLDDIQYE
ncbi:MAG: hypothetical protein A2X46_04515 [Lentisphaerae bacterium GWF2_57_35]|nr:MAG: hypothetical protein A2X46_04515 [Lentisphaerae bacterium GWF2_57_35]